MGESKHATLLLKTEVRPQVQLYFVTEPSLKELLGNCLAGVLLVGNLFCVVATHMRDASRLDTRKNYASLSARKRR